MISTDEFGFTFAGQHSRDFDLKVINIQRNPLPNMSRQVTDVPAVIGELYQGTSLQERQFVVDVKFDGLESIEDLADHINMVGDWLQPEGTLEPDLIFDDQPDVTYYGSCSNITAPTRELYNAKFSITFNCSNPTGYYPKQTYDLNKSGNDIQVKNQDGMNDTSLIRPFGDQSSIVMNADRSTTINYPIFHLKAEETLYNISVDSHPLGGSVNSDDDTAFVDIGDSDDEKDGADDFNKVIVNDYCNDLSSNWVQIKDKNSLPFDLGPTRTISSGASLRTTPNAIRVGFSEFDQTIKYTKGAVKKHRKIRNFGDAPAGQEYKTWHGPGAMYTPFTVPCSDFEVTARFQIDQYAGEARDLGEIILLDTGGREVARMGIKDNSYGEKAIIYCYIGKYGDGNYHTIYSTQVQPLKGHHTITYKVYDKSPAKKKSNSKPKRRARARAMFATSLLARKAKPKKKKKKHVIHKRKAKKKKKKHVRKKTVTHHVKGKAKTTVKWRTVKIDSTSQKGVYSSFYGNLTLRKVGQQWSFSINTMSRSTGHVYKSKVFRFTDYQNKFSNINIQRAFLYFAKWDNHMDHADPRYYYKQDNIGFCYLKVQNIDDPSLLDGKKEPVARKGDEIVINTETGQVAKAGKEFNDRLTASSNVSGLALKGKEQRRIILSPSPTSKNHWWIEHRNTTI